MLLKGGICIDILIIKLLFFPTPLVLALFLAAATLFLCSFLKCFFVLVFLMLFLCNIANIAQRTFKIIQKSRSRKHGDIINYVDKNIKCMSTARARDRKSRDFHVRGTA